MKEADRKKQVIIIFGQAFVYTRIFILQDFFSVRVLTLCPLYISGLSTWGRRVGRKFDQIKINDPTSEKLQYVVTPPSPGPSIQRPTSICSNHEDMINRAEDTWSQQTAASSQADLHVTSAGGAPAGGGHRPPEVTVKRRVSRVESLRNLFFNKGHPHDARRKFLLKKRTRSEEKEKVSII